MARRRRAPAVSHILKPIVLTIVSVKLARTIIEFTRRRDGTKAPKQLPKRCDRSNKILTWQGHSPLIRCGSESEVRSQESEFRRPVSGCNERTCEHNEN